MLLWQISRSLHRTLQTPRARFLTTYPKPIPSYVSIWDPTKPSRPRKRSAAFKVREDDASKNEARKVQRRELRDTQRTRIPMVAVWRSQSLDTQYAIRRLNYFLRLAESKDSKRMPHAQLWRAYSLAKRHVPSLPSLLPDKVWDIIWATQATGKSRLRRRRLRPRRSHTEELYRDMHTAGKPATLGQRVAYLESVFLSGKEEKALAEWEEDHGVTDGPSRHDYKPEHLELGAKLHALAGNADRARSIMDELFDLYPTWNPSFMKAVLRAHVELEPDQHREAAQRIYSQMKERMGEAMSLEDYDSCFVGFLKARHLRHARGVFQDMVKNGRLASSFTDEQIDAVLKRLNMLYHLGNDIEKVTGIALQAISILPQAYHSRVFGDWMKSAVIRKAPEAAAQILDMMHNRGNPPDTIHFNLFIKALLRTKDEPRVLKAENIGWQMIEAARKAPPDKFPDQTANEAVKERELLTSRPAPHDEITKAVVPKANVTTFALMMRHHANNSQWEHVDYLARQMKGTGIQPNAGLMNVLMDNKCRRGKYSEVWKIYKGLTDVREGSPGVFPDGASIRCLWKTLRLALGDHATRNDPDLPTPRQLLAETAAWWTRCRNRHDSERFRTGLAALNRSALTSLMMHCFSYTQDLAGSMVALHVMRTYFNIFPTDKAAAVLQKQAAWIDMHRETRSVRSQFQHSRINAKNVEKMGRIYHILMERRLQRMNMTGDQFAYLSEEQTADFSLNLLSEFIRVILKRSYPPDVVEAMMEEAKKEANVPDLLTGDMDSFEVA